MDIGEKVKRGRDTFPTYLLLPWLIAPAGDGVVAYDPR
jgi:hypothetical protein